MKILDKIERPAEYVKLAEHDNRDALVTLLDSIGLECRFGEYAHPHIVKSKDYPRLYGSKIWILAMHSHYQLGREYKKTWNQTWSDIRWFFTGYDAKSKETKA